VERAVRGRAAGTAPLFLRTSIGEQRVGRRVEHFGRARVEAVDGLRILSGVEVRLFVRFASDRLDRLGPRRLHGLAARWLDHVGGELRRRLGRRFGGLDRLVRDVDDIGHARLASLMCAVRAAGLVDAAASVTVLEELAGVSATISAHHVAVVAGKGCVGDANAVARFGHTLPGVLCHRFAGRSLGADRGRGLAIDAAVAPREEPEAEIPG
jgi:hypothetical protein